MTSQETGALRVIAASLALPLVTQRITEMERSLGFRSMLPEQRQAAENQIAALKRQRNRMRSVIDTTIF